ncbi:hypothetical protein P9847_05620 [Paenibacillus chibensis]|uniref:Uncharacterized protein n=1 Tax=Paenibacillus chibensis TaxID=59846 RepID=A0ABU6PPH9_9BACL|nr:hypothetical protein [Paenibacillus chibensis]
MKISSVAELIANSSFLRSEGYTSNDLNVVIQDILESIDIIGEDNLYLRNHLNLEETVSYFRKREVPLSGDEIVNGDFFVFEYIGHNGDMFLRQYNSLIDIEEQITSGSGITNPFTTYQVAIVNGGVKEYEIYFTDKTDGIEYKFIKDLHDALPEFQSIFSKSRKPKRREYEITDVRIVWID